MDDLSRIRQYKKDSVFTIFNPSPAYLINGSSELDRSSAEFTGLNTSRGVNPSTGVVIYYQLPAFNKKLWDGGVGAIWKN